MVVRSESVRLPRPVQLDMSAQDMRKRTRLQKVDNPQRTVVVSCGIVNQQPARHQEISGKKNAGSAVVKCHELSNGERITSSTLLRTAGLSPNPALDLVACPKERGRIKVNANLEVEGVGRWAIARSCLIARRAAIVRRPHNMRRAKEKLLHTTSSRAFARSTSFSRKISCSISINARWHIRRPRHALPRGIASSCPPQTTSIIALRRKD